VNNKHSFSITNEKFVSNTLKKVLKKASGLLVFLGRPLFLILTFSFLLFTLFFYITGYFFVKVKRLIKSSFTEIWAKLRKLGKNIKNFKQIKLPKKGLQQKVVFISKTKKSALQLFPKISNAIGKATYKFSKSLPLLSRIFLKPVLFIRNKFDLFFLRIKLSVFKESRNLLKLLTLFFTIGFLLLALALVSFWFLIIKDLPSAKALTQKLMPASTKIYDRNGVLLYTIFKDQNRTPVPLSQIPLEVRSATIAAEDAEFYSHPGFSIKGIFRALYKDIKEKKLTGGSTITQQLVKNTLLTPEKTLIRKLKEIVLAIKVELTYDKNQILEMYLNEVYYGGSAYGIQEAAKLYFGKDVSELTLGEAAFLAGLPKSPSYFSPYGENRKKAIARQKEVLNLMLINGFINKDQKQKAEEEELKFAPNKIEIKAPHFVFFVKDQLEKKFGSKVLTEGGLKVTTTLDMRVQELAERIIKEEVEKLKSLNVTNGAAIVIKPDTGEILAMVGSYDYFDDEHDGNVNVVTRPRQPGSSIKVVNYAYAFSNGLTPATIVNDSPTTFLVEGQKPYTPKNYEGGYRGSLTLRSALAESRNIPAVKILASYGVEKMVEMGRKMGITTWENPEDYGLSLTLGGGEVKLIDLARVYATLANYGVRPEIRSILKISDSNGKILEEFKCREEGEMLVQASSSSAFLDLKRPLGCGGEKVLDPRVAFIITDILKDNSARAPSFGSNSLLNIPNHKEVAVKTGTSNNLRDNLTIGYTKDYLVAVWVGNNDGSPMARIASGVTGATPIWNKIMSALLADKPSYNWPTPEGLVQLPICPYTGTLSCQGCIGRLEWFLEENKPTKACSPEWFKKDNYQEEENQEKKDKPRPKIQIYKPGSFLDKLIESRFGKKKKETNF